MRFVTLLLLLTLLILSADSAMAENWMVTPIAGAPPDQIRVQVTANLPGGNPCQYPTVCSQWHQTTMMVSPCPVGQTCAGDVLMRLYPIAPQQVVETFDLRCGIQYTFSGGISSHFRLPNPLSGCASTLPCDWVQTMTPATFYWGATPTRPLSFGRLKMLYR